MAPPESHVAGMIPVPGPRYPWGGPAVGNLPSHLPLPELSALAGPNGPNEYRLLDRPKQSMSQIQKKEGSRAQGISYFNVLFEDEVYMISLYITYISICLFAQSLFKENAQRHEQTHDIHIHMKCTYLSFQRQPSTILRRSMIFLDAYLIII